MSSHYLTKISLQTSTQPLSLSTFSIDKVDPTIQLKVNADYTLVWSRDSKVTLIYAAVKTNQAEGQYVCLKKKVGLIPFSVTDKERALIYKWLIKPLELEFGITYVPDQLKLGQASFEFMHLARTIVLTDYDEATIAENGLRLMIGGQVGYLAVNEADNAANDTVDHIDKGLRDAYDAFDEILENVKSTSAWGKFSNYYPETKVSIEDGEENVIDTLNADETLNALFADLEKVIGDQMDVAMDDTTNRDGPDRPFEPIEPAVEAFAKSVMPRYMVDLEVPSVPLLSGPEYTVAYNAIGMAINAWYAHMAAGAHPELDDVIQAFTRAVRSVIEIYFMAYGNTSIGTTRPCIADGNMMLIGDERPYPSMVKAYVTRDTRLPVYSSDYEMFGSRLTLFERDSLPQYALNFDGIPTDANIFEREYNAVVTHTYTGTLSITPKYIYTIGAPYDETSTQIIIRGVVVYITYNPSPPMRPSNRAVFIYARDVNGVLFR